MIIVPQEERTTVQPLFAAVPMWRAAIASAVEDGYGEIRTDSLVNPSMAVLFYGGLVIYAGDPSGEEAHCLVQEYPVQPAILAYSKNWNKVLTRVYGNRLRAIARYHMPFAALSHNRIAEIRQSPRFGNVSEIGCDDFDELHSRLSWEHQFYHYKNREEFVRQAYGFVYKCDEQIQAGASAFIRSSKHMECQVNTVERSRRQGLATLVAAAFVAKCLEENRIIPWDAANIASVKLGKRLGYQEVQQYEVLELTE